MDIANMWSLIAIGSSVLVIIIALYSIWTYRITKRAEECCAHHVYCMTRTPLLGNAMMLVALKNTQAIWNFLTYCGSRYKKGVLFWLFHIPWLVIVELDVVEAVLQSSESVEKSYAYQLLDTVTEGVFSVNGIRWRKLRKKLNLTFSQKQIDMIYADVNEQTAICIDVLKKKTDKYINIMTYMTTYFFDIVARTHFSVETYEQTERDAYTTEVAARIIEMTVEHRVFKLQNHLQVFFEMTRVKKFIKYFREHPIGFIRKIVATRLEAAKMEQANGISGERKRICYVDGVKEALEELDIEPSVANIEKNIGDMLIAASDTTSVAVSTVFYYLAIYQDVQEKVYQEILPLFAEQSTIDFTRENLNQMEYLEMVIKETLRHTSPPGIIREVRKELNVGKYIIPKTTNAYLAIGSIHKSPEYYEKPEEFYPEHFSAERVKTRPKYAFLPFSQGPRNCPGMVYSYITMKAIISSVIRNFKLDTNIPLKDIQYKMILMREHKNGYYVRLTPRI